MIGALEAAWVIARKEVAEHIRSKRIYFIGGFFFATFLAASILGATIESDGSFFGDGPGASVRFILLIYFSFALLGGFAFTSVLAVALSADAVCGEWRDRTLFLLLSKPVTRGSMLAGKIAGAYASVAAIFAITFIVCLSLLVILVGWPDSASWGMIWGGFGIVLLGLLPFVAVGVLCSALFRSPITSFVVALALWFLVFPLLGNIGFFIDWASGMPIDQWGRSPLSRTLALLSPSALLQAAGPIWAGREEIFGGPQAALPDHPALIILAMLAHSLVYVGLSYWVVRRRDYA